MRHRTIPPAAATLALLALTGGCAAPAPRASQSARDADAVAAVLQRQAAAWNRGDLDAFMADYHPDVTFASGGQITRGRDQTLARYRKRYATREQMGTLSFSAIEFHPLGKNAMLVLGEWNLKRAGEQGPLGGNFSLVWTRANGAWRILHDHTSLRPGASAGAPD